MKQNILLLSANGKQFHVEIPEMYANTHHIPHHIVNQLDVAYIEYGVNVIKHYTDYSQVHDMMINFNRNKTTKIWYKDFNRAVTHHFHDFENFLANYQ